jgi:hypothetical protein
MHTHPLCLLFSVSVVVLQCLSGCLCWPPLCCRVIVYMAALLSFAGSSFSWSALWAFVSCSCVVAAPHNPSLRFPGAPWRLSTVALRNIEPLQTIICRANDQDCSAISGYFSNHIRRQVVRCVARLPYVPVHKATVCPCTRLPYVPVRVSWSLNQSGNHLVVAHAAPFCS